MKFKLSVSFLILVLIEINGGLFADKWYNNYERALKAVDSQNWAEAVSYLQEALNDKPTPNPEAKTTGLRFIKYIPYYYLGLSYYKLGKYKEAAAAFKSSLDYGVIRSIPDLFSSLEKMSSDCDKKLSAVPQEQPAQSKPVVSKNAEMIDMYINSGESQYTQEKYSDALESFNIAKNLIEKTGERTSDLPVVNARIEGAKQKIRIRTSLDRADKMSRDGRYQDAIAEVRKILDTDSDNAEARRLLASIENQQKQKSDSEKSRITTEKITVSEPIKEDYKKLMEDGRTFFNNGEYGKAIAKLNAALEIKEGDREALRLLKTVEYSKSVDDINMAVEYYFNGRVKDCEKMMASSVRTLSVMPEYKDKMVTALTFLAAALIDQHFLEGRTTMELLNEAMKKIERIYELKPDFELHREYFSPKVRFFFERAKRKSTGILNEELNRNLPKRPLPRNLRLKNS